MKTTQITHLRKALYILCILAFPLILGTAGCAKTASPADPKPAAGTEQAETSVSSGLPKDSETEDRTKGQTVSVSEITLPENTLPKITLPTLSVVIKSGSDTSVVPSSAGGYTLNTPQPDGTMQSAIACGADPLTALAQSGKEIPFADFGSQIILSFDDGSQPDSISLTDMILKEDGSAQYGEPTFIHTDLECRGGKAEFTLEENPAAYLSSTMNPEGFYRGFRVNCIWENGSEAEYAFILRTNPPFSEEPLPAP